MRKILTLCLIHEPPNILLGLKKRGFGHGRWNGFGGKVEAGESIDEAAKRELLEEVGISAKLLEKWGILEFQYQPSADVSEVHVFKVLEYTGEPTESEEMKPQWFPVSAIPFGQMWPDDAHWWPLFLAGQKFRGRVLFDKDHEIIEKHLEGVEAVD
jgi:8-oxo-dGTP diphosphatase/2-hydroxy-dATP diphosphatase